MSSQLSFSASPSLKRRRSSYAPSQASRSGGRKRRTIGRYGLGSALASKTPVFTETFDAGRITTNTNGTFQARMSQIPELADYAALYRSYKILKLQWIILPNANTASPGGTTSGIGQFFYAIDPSAQLATPGSLTDVLNNNNVRMTLTDRAVVLPKYTPVPQVDIVAAAGNVPMSFMKPQWLDFGTAGAAIDHNGVTWGYLAASTGGQTNAQVFCKVTFACKDPR
jgi:hypothetical protein